MTAPVPVIEIRDLHKSYGELEVLKGVDMVAPKGHVVSLIGSSGSGKSTLLRCANLLEDSQEGEILLRGRADPLARQRARPPAPADRRQVTRIRTNLSMVFQQFNLWSHMTILQNVMEAPVTVLKRDPKEVEEKARDYLAKVGIADKADAWPAQLSGGQQQRAAIARALCMEPRALLFDEPTSRWTPSWSRKWSRSSRPWPTKAGPCCWSPTTCGWPATVRTTSSSCTRAGSRKRARPTACSARRRRSGCNSSCGRPRHDLPAARGLCGLYRRRHDRPADFRPWARCPPQSRG